MQHATLWIMNLVESSIPYVELARYEKGELRAAKLIKDADRFETVSFHWLREPGVARDLEDGDWFVQVIKYKDQSTVVYPPGQFRSLDAYGRGNGKKRWFFHLEVPKRGESMEWKRFQKWAKSALGGNASTLPRTRPIRDIRAADSILSMDASRAYFPEVTPGPSQNSLCCGREFEKGEPGYETRQSRGGALRRNGEFKRTSTEDDSAYFFFAFGAACALAGTPGLLAVRRPLSTVPFGEPSPLAASQPGPAS